MHKPSTTRLSALIASVAVTATVLALIDDLAQPVGAAPLHASAVGSGAVLAAGAPLVAAR